MPYSPAIHLEKYSASKKPGRQEGFVLFISLIIVLLVGIVAVSSLRITEMTESLSGNSIQRSRAFQAAEGALIEAEKSAVVMAKNRTFANPSSSNGLYSSGSLADNWWRSTNTTFVTTQPVIKYPGVFAQPSYVIEEVGNYVSDGGSGIVSLDRGSARYGSKTNSGREVVLFRLQAHGTGNTENSQAVVESLYVESR